MTTAEAVLDRLVQEVESSGFGAHGIQVQIGDDVASHRWAPDVREEIHSLAKAVSVLAAGIAADEGAIALDAPVSVYLPDAPFGSGSENITLRHLLSMTSGVDFPWSATMMTDWPDLSSEFLSRASRGRVFQYSNASTYTAMRVLETRVGDIEEYVRLRLFVPLGFGDVTWQRCPNGFVLAGEGLALRTDEIARLGVLIRDRGMWGERRLVSTEWIDAMHTDWVDAGVNPGYTQYALSGWRGPRSAWRLHGANGQLILFVGDAVVTVTADDHFGADAFADTVVRVLED